MIDLTSKEEAVKHLQHIENTIVDIEEPLKGYKDDYTFQLTYLGNVIYMINTRPLDIKINDLIKEKTNERRTTENN